MWRRLRRTLYALTGAAVLGPVLAFAIGWVLFDVPTADEAAVPQVATFTYSDASTPLATVRPEGGNRVVVTIDQVPEHLREAVLAAEDRSFYSNPGFDVMGIGRAVWNQLTGGVGGGSTITQQYVKVSTGQDDNTLWRKYQEIVLAVKISREQTKDQVLENYLNVIYLGRGAYGVQAASQAYFAKDVGELSVSESAMLAGVIASPSRWDPAQNIDQSVRRWNLVLDGMVGEGWLTPAERATQQFPQWQQQAPSEGVGIPGDSLGHVYNQARQELEAEGITPQQIDTQGLTITTTIDPEYQQHAIDAVTDVLAEHPDQLRAALASVDPRSGAIRAYYGGENGVGTDYAQALRQPGSSFKPFVLSAALQADEDIGLGTTFDGSSPREFNGIEVNNSEGFNCARCTVQTAMTRSINTVFYEMALDAGLPNVTAAAHQAGIPADLVSDPRGGLALGDQEVHPVDMAAAFATFAADGERFTPHIVSRVVAASGQVLLDRGTPVGEQTVPADVARNVTESMSQVAGSSGIALGGGRATAVKTGTVQHPALANQNKDAWTVGYTPSLSTAVWIGTDTSEPIQTTSGSPIFGRMAPGSIWQDFMNDALGGTEVEQFSRFVPLGAPPMVETDRQAGSTPTDPPGSGSPAPPFTPQAPPGSGPPPDDGDSADGDRGDGSGGSGGSGGSDGSDGGEFGDGGDVGPGPGPGPGFGTGPGRGPGDIGDGGGFDPGRFQPDLPFNDP